MEDTTRAIVTLAAASLVLAPVFNGVLEEAIASAEVRDLPFKDVDWDGEPPDELPEDYEGEPPQGDGDPPENLPDGEGQIPPGAGGCDLQTERVAEWNHANPQDDPQTALQNRTNDAFRDSETFTIDAHHVGIGVHFQADNMSGRFTVALEDPSGNVPWSSGQNSASSKPYNVTYEHPRPEQGTWTVSIDTTGATYDDLTLLVVRATCQQATSGGSQ